MTEVLKEIARWEMLVHCSKTPEPLGRVVLEGMATGCAVIASNLGGPKEVVKQGVTGLIAEPTVEDVYKTLKHFLDDPNVMKKVSLQAQKEIKNEYEWEKVITNFKSMLE